MHNPHIHTAVQEVCDAINIQGRAILVGGYIRNQFFGTSTIDIDIEVYEIATLSHLQNLLSPFGTLNVAGKSFGVLMLKYQGFHFDITLARKENAIGVGHKDFHITPAPFESFATIALRRDFTMNAIGYDTKKELLLDPFNGMEAIYTSVLDVINPARFAEDALRVLRAVGFISRFNLTPTPRLLALSKEIVKSGHIHLLSPERIFDELYKWITKAQDLDKGIAFLDAIHLNIFPPLSQTTLNRVAASPKSFEIRWVLLYSQCPEDDAHKNLSTLTRDKKLLRGVHALNSAFRAYKMAYEDGATTDANYRLLALVMPFKKLYELFLAYDPTMADTLALKTRALGVYQAPLKALLTGQQLIDQGYPSDASMKTYLDQAYALQCLHPQWDTLRLLHALKPKPSVG